MAEKTLSLTKELLPENLRKVCNPNIFNFNTTQEVQPLHGTIGQERGVHSIEFGLNVLSRGFNIYVAGPLGTGKRSTIKAILKEKTESLPVPGDWIYLNNFEDPDKPFAVQLSAGMGKVFVSDMDNLIGHCKVEIPKAFESEEYEKQKTAVLQEYQKKREEFLNQLQQKAKGINLSIQITPSGIVTVPIVDGKQLKQEEFENLNEEQKQQIRTSGESIQQDINIFINRVRKIEQETKNKITEMDKKVALFAVGHLFESLKQKYCNEKKICDYLEKVQDDIVSHIDEFKPSDKEQHQFLGLEMMKEEAFISRYKVNVFVDNSQLKGAPVVFEHNPTYYNLFGRIEYKAHLGMMTTDFSMIKSGAIHRANGGFLVVEALELLLNYFSWDALKRTLRSEQSEIENIGEQFRTFPAASLKPEPMPINIKVILVGNYYIYQLLYHLDEDFRKLFKVRADFDINMPRSEENEKNYVSFIGARCKESKLLPFTPSACAGIVEYGSWLAESQEKLSTRFLELSNIINESSHWAVTEGCSIVEARHVNRAIGEKTYRSNMVEEKLSEHIKSGVILIDVTGSIVGQVNGISLIDMGDYTFGRPSRITARTYSGQAGIVNIEREVKLSGPIHNKGVMILSSYIAGKFAQDKVLNLSASIAFEQMYEEIEGDSASSAELYALISSLSGFAIRQDIAVTGSVNQRGQIQPVGGINRKIEGFFDTCKMNGLTETQGVIMPKQNVRHLMLRTDVIEAVKQGKFHIYAIENIEEGIELLTGKFAGKPGKNNRYTNGTVFYSVDERLREFSRQAEKKKSKK